MPAIDGELDIFYSCPLEPNVMYSVLSAFNFSLIWSIQDFIAANVVSSFSFVHYLSIYLRQGMISLVNGHWLIHV